MDLKKIKIMALPGRGGGVCRWQITDVGNARILRVICAAKLAVLTLPYLLLLLLASLIKSVTIEDDL